jgi:predicted ATPase/DNA-binding XRE family transcriptional regulator
MNHSASFGDWLRQGRKALDLTQEDLAERIGCATETIRKIEAGRRRPSKQVTELLAETLGIAPEERSHFVQLARVNTLASTAILQPALSKRPVTNLPAPVTSFIGRNKEIESLRTVLRREGIRLLTLTGAGGSGKTRLAIQVAQGLLEDFIDGVFFISLAPFRNRTQVESAIAQTLDVHEIPDRPPAMSIKEFLRNRQLLLVLDNIEQVADGALLVTQLLDEAFRLKIILTSRSALHAYGEHDFVVPSLALPDLTQLPPLDSLFEYEAVRLFVERAQAVDSGFAMNSANAAAIAEICHRLDGLPLAIELAAARTRLMSPQAMLGRLGVGGGQLRLLTGGPRTLPLRQQTLRNTLDWSYSLLDTQEQILFRHMTIFVGGCSMEAVEAVCTVEGDTNIDFTDLVESLIDKSLVQVKKLSDDTLRFTTLETIREYGLECLAKSKETAAIQRRHAMYFVDLAERAEQELCGPQQDLWLERLEAEHNNLREALKWSLQHNENEIALRLASALWQFWAARSHLSEGRAWIERALSPRHSATLSRRLSAVNRARSRPFRPLDTFAQLSRARDWREYMSVLESSSLLSGPRALKRVNPPAWVEPIWRRTLLTRGDSSEGAIYFHNKLNRGPWQLARLLALFTSKRAGGVTLSLQAKALNGAGVLARNSGDYEPAITHHMESLTIYRELEDLQGIAASLNNLGIIALDQSDYGSAVVLHSESLAVKRELGDKRGIAASLHNLGAVAIHQGHYRRALELHEESLALFRQLGDKRNIASSLTNLGSAALHNGDYERAAALHEESLTLFRQLGDKRSVARSLTNLGNIALHQGDFERAAALHEESSVLKRELIEEGRIGEHQESLVGMDIKVRESVQAAWQRWWQTLGTRPG